MTLCPGLPRWAGTRKVKLIWILLKQETVSGSGIRWAICKSAPCSRQITTPAPHHSSVLQAGCPSCHPTNSVKALKAKTREGHCFIYGTVLGLWWQKLISARHALLSFDRRHLSYGDRLQVKGGYSQKFSVLCCVRQLCTMVCTQIWASFCCKSAFWIWVT